MLQQITAFINNHQLLEKNSTVLAGISGGPDSMALLSVLRSLQEAWELKVIALSVDHQLRGKDSRDDLAYVKDVCRKWDILFEGTSVDVTSFKKEHQVGTQVAARELRYQFFKTQMEKYQAGFLALGHHADDQIETVLMNLARSGNPETLTGIPMKRSFASGMIIRPLLCVRKKDIESYCRMKGITPRFDASNADTAYTRNAVRKHIIPYFKELNPNVHQSLEHLSESLREDAAFLEEMARQMAERVVTFEAGKASFAIKTFKSYPSALQRRTYHLILSHLYTEIPKDLSYKHEKSFFQFMENKEGNKTMDLPHPLKIAKTYGHVTIYDTFFESDDSAYDIFVNIPGETSIPGGSKLLSSQSEYHDTKGKYTYVCSRSEVVFPLHVRTRKQGDRMQWEGLGGSKKLKDIFIDYKVPSQERDRWPIVTDHTGCVLWLVGLKKRKLAESANKEPYIYLTYKHKNDDRG